MLFDLIKNLMKQLLLCFIFTITCGFNPVGFFFKDLNTMPDPTDIFYKNFNIIPDPINGTDIYWHLPKIYKEAQSEKIMPTLKLPQIDLSENLMRNFSLKKIIPQPITSVNEIVDGLVPSSDGIDFALGGIKRFNVNNAVNIDTTLNYLESETQALPILNDMSGMPYMYNNDTPIIKKIEDIKIPGLDDVLPTSVGAPLTPKDYDLQKNFDFFTDFITPEQVLDSKVSDIIP